MKEETMKELIAELRKASLDTLAEKNARYSPGEDKLHNFRFRDREDLLEKCKDIINYICFLWCIGCEGAT